jgi:glycosyltransferase involved in cell wall biosynthesis
MEPELIPRMELQARTLLENNYKVIHIGWDRRKDHSSEEVVNKVRFIRTGPYLSIRNTSEFQSDRTFWGVPGQNGLRNLRRIALLYFNIYRALSKQQIDILHCTHVALLPFAVLFGKIKQKKIIYEAVEFYISQVFDGFPRSLRFLKLLAIYIEGLLVRYVDAVICIPSTKSKLLRIYSKNNKFVREIYNVPVLENAIDKNLYRDLKNKYANRYIFIYAGAITLEKGILNIVKAIDNVKKYHPEVKLVLIGSAIGDDTGYLAEYINKNELKEFIDIISFQPYNKLFTYYSVADVGIGLIQKSIANKFTKGGSRKLIEYMKASLALLVTNDGNVGIVAKEEKCGILVNVWDEKILNENIMWMLEHPLEIKKMGARGKMAHIAKYNWNLESDKFLQIYNCI